jgi:hypothetical protein
MLARIERTSGGASNDLVAPIVAMAIGRRLPAHIAGANSEEKESSTCEAPQQNLRRQPV